MFPLHTLCDDRGADDQRSWMTTLWMTLRDDRSG
jgi:hypothetical protein